MVPVRVRAPFAQISYLVMALAGIGFGQGSPDNNNPYSPSPARQGKTIAAKRPEPARTAFVLAPSSEAADERMAGFGLAPTAVYRVGIGDTLQIRLNDNVASDYVVRKDGTIDFPLAATDPSVAGQTVESIKSMLKPRVALYPNADVAVTVREYASHKIDVAGLVDSPGAISLRREAIPLYVIKAMTMVHREAKVVNLYRSDEGSAEKHLLQDSDTDNIPIYPGDRVEFAVE